MMLIGSGTDSGDEMIFRRSLLMAITTVATSRPRSKPSTSSKTQMATLIGTTRMMTVSLAKHCRSVKQRGFIVAKKSALNKSK